MNKRVIRITVLVTLMVTSLVLTAFAADEEIIEGHVGTASKANLEKVHPTPGCALATASITPPPPAI
jgi:hypothetical protein